MNAKEKTTQKAKSTERKRTRPGAARATLLAQLAPGTLEDATPRKRTSGLNPRSSDSAPNEAVTVVEAKIDVGMSNMVFIRGQGNGLSWFQGVPLSCVDPKTWVWSTTQAKEKVVFKLLLNDQLWAKGEDVVVEAGRKIEIVPSF